MESHPRTAADATTDSTPARAGEQVWMIINYVRADKRDEWEQFVRRIHAAAQQTQPDADKLVRAFLADKPNDDGTYTSVFLMDPVVEGVDYSIVAILTNAYGAEQANTYADAGFGCLAREGEAHEISPLAW